MRECATVNRKVRTLVWRWFWRAATQAPVCLVMLGPWLLAGCSAGSRTEQALSGRLFAHVLIIGSRGTALGQFNKPRSVAVDRQDNLYVVDMTGRVQKFSPEGEFLLSWQMPQTDLGKPKGMALDPAGNIIVLEPHYQRVNHFTPEGTLVAQWGKAGTNAGEFTLPRAVAINSRHEIYVSEYTVVDRLQKFMVRSLVRGPVSHQSLRADTDAPPPNSDPNVSFIGVIGRPGDGQGEFNRAEGLGIGPDDRLYVADSCNHRIQVFSREGQWLRSYGKPGRGPGELSYPYDVRVDPEGRQYVCEFGNSRVQVFNTNDKLIEIIGGPGSKPGQFNNPWSIALDSRGNLYVADSGNHRVQKLVRRRGT